MFVRIVDIVMKVCDGNRCEVDGEVHNVFVV